MSHTPTLLLAHADRDARQGLAHQLDLDGYAVHEASSATGAAQALPQVCPMMLLLGRLERPARALTLLRDLRQGRIDRADVNLPVVTLGAMDAVTQIRAYETGSDHHLASDTGYVMLRAVIAAVVRRATGPDTSPRLIELGSLAIDVAGREVRSSGQPLDVPCREFELLRTLATDPTRVFTKRELLKRIWGYEDPRSTRTLDSHACRLRRRLAEHGHPGMIRVQWGVGYRLAA